VFSYEIPPHSVILKKEKNMYETNINKKFTAEKFFQKIWRGVLYLFTSLICGTIIVVFISQSYDSVVAIIYAILGLMGLFLTTGSIANLIKLFRKLILEIK
jgi:hypothetical protein